MDAPKWMASVFAIAFVLSACKPPKPEPLPDPPAKHARFNYHYKRPEALGPMPRTLRVALPTVPSSDPAKYGEEKARRLCAALGVQLDPGKLERAGDAHNEILSLRDPRYRLKVYVPSGMIKFRDTTRHGRNPEALDGMRAPDGQLAIERARQIVDSLAKHGLVQSEQLLMDSARVSHMKARGGAGRAANQTGRPMPGPVDIVDTRVFIPRAIGALGVSGHGVRIVLDKSGEISGLDLLWRDLEIDEARTGLPAKLTMERATRLFESELVVPADAVVDVIANELVYFDPSMRDPVAFLEPGYLFVYQVKVPTKDRGEFRVSKVLHRLIPAIDHGLTQVASPRDERLRKLRPAMELRRPEKVSAVPEREESEEVERE